MVSPERIQQLADRIGSLFRPDRVILFGSYAYGTPTEDSDVDILVVMPARERDRDRATEIRDALDDHFAKDILVYDPGYLQKRYDMEDWFVRDMVERGRVLYESDHPGVG